MFVVHNMAAEVADVAVACRLAKPVMAHSTAGAAGTRAHVPQA